jgi:hypothetical protein
MEDKELNIRRLAALNGMNPYDPAFESKKKFCLSDREKTFFDASEKEVDCYPSEDVKQFIEIGDKIFYAEGYADNKVSTEEFDYAANKWEKFKKFAGPKLT